VFGLSALRVFVISFQRTKLPNVRNNRTDRGLTMSEYTNSAPATLDVSSTMFGIAPVQFSLTDAPIEGAGSVATTWAGVYEGDIWYHSIQDMSGKRYKLDCCLENGKLVVKFLDPTDSMKERMVFQCNSIVSPNHGQTTFSGIVQFS
jgi:hypothetical protein